MRFVGLVVASALIAAAGCGGDDGPRGGGDAGDSGDGGGGVDGGTADAGGADDAGTAGDAGDADGGSSCDCVAGEACVDGVCTCDGACDDDNACTVDSCGTEDRCRHECIEDPANVAVLDCAACAISACAPGYRDDDGDVSNGCEADAADHYVDAENVADPLEDGSMAHPFDTIGEAIAVVTAGDVVHVAAGAYSGGFDVTVPGVSVQGAGAAEVTLDVPDGGTGFHATASRFAAGGMTIRGGRYGVHFEGAAGTLTRGTVRDLVATGQRGGMSEDAAGVRVDDVLMLEVDGLVVDDVEGGVGMDVTGDGGPGGDGSGLALHDVSECSVRAVRATNIRGGTGGEGFGSNDGGVGGLAAGLRVDGATDCEIDGVDVADVTGGTGGYCFGSYAVGGRGGDGVAVHLVDATATTVRHVSGIRLTGGAGGEGYGSLAMGGPGGNGVGVHAGSGTAVDLSQLTLVRVDPGAAGPDGGAASVDGTPGDAHGVELAASFATAPAVANVIFSGVGGHCAFSDAANAETDLHVRAAITHGCATATATNATVDSVSSLDPEFLNPASDDLRVLGTSPAVDQGEATADCTSEPAPNGCRANIGRWGNTPAAASASGASHCAVCP